MEARTASAEFEISQRNLAKDCICVCLCDEGTFGFGNCVCVCVCGAGDEGLPSPVGTPPSQRTGLPQPEEICVRIEKT